MDSETVRGRILGRLDDYDAEHDTLGCQATHCIHDGAKALRALMELHKPEPWHEGEADYAHIPCEQFGNPHPEYRCAGCSDVDDTGGHWNTSPCQTVTAIAEALGISTEGGRDA